MFVISVVMLAFVIFAIAIVWRPASVLAFAVCVYPFEQWAQANSAYFGANSALMNYGLGLLTLFALACVIMRGNNPLQPTSSAMWMWLALYVYAGVSCIWSLDRETSLFLYRYHAPYMITFVGLLPLVIQKPDDIRIGFLSTLIFGTIVMGLLFWDTGIHAWGRTIEVAKGAGVVDRVGQSHTRLSPLAVAEAACEIAIIAMLMTFKGVNRIWQILRWGIVFVALALIYRSGSRGQLFATILAVMAFITLSRGMASARGWITTFATVTIIFFIASFTFAMFGDTTGSRWKLDRMGDTLSATRFDYSMILLKYWLDSSPIHWLFGLGSSASFDARLLGIYCHVVVIEILAELGLIGFLLISAFVLLVIRDGFRLYQATKDSDTERGTAMALCAMFFFQIILTFKERSFLTHTLTLGTGLMICRYAAIVTAHKKQERIRAVKRWFIGQSQMAAQLQSTP